jgi:TolB-like protein
MRCLEKKPADRWQKAEDILHQLETIQAPSSGTLPLSSVTAVPGHGWWSRGQLAAAVAGVATLAALGYALFSGPISDGSADGHLPTIAVLPFENLGAPDDEYFADGMTEELTGRLAKVSGLSVIARTSAIQYKKATKSIPQIAKELGADFLVEGTVRWKRTPTARVRIAPQVVRAERDVCGPSGHKPYGTGSSRSRVRLPSA